MAPALGYCDDEAVNDAPFYVMGFVDGHVLRDRDDAEQLLDVAGRAEASESIVDTMAAIHAVDLDAVGLSELGKHEGYIARQLKRWYGQWNAQKTRELPAVDAVHDALLTRIPEQGPATIVHGDYRLDNCMVGRRRSRGRRARLGDLHPRRPARRRRPAAGVLDGSERLPVGMDGRCHDGTRVPRPSRAGDALRGRERPRPQRRCRSTSRSPSGSSPASSRACTPRYLGGALGERRAAELEPFKLQVEARQRPRWPPWRHW